jgi:hypothetical protein
VGETLRVEQPAPGGATFVAIHLRTFFMLGLLTALLGTVGSLVATYGWPGSNRHWGLAFFCVVSWVIAACRATAAFLRRDRPTLIDVTFGEILTQSPARRAIRNVTRIGVGRQRLALIPLGSWHVRVYASDLPSFDFDVRVDNQPSVPLLWYRQRADAEQAARVIDDAYRGRRSIEPAAASTARDGASTPARTDGNAV